MRREEGDAETVSLSDRSPGAVCHSCGSPTVRFGGPAAWAQCCFLADLGSDRSSSGRRASSAYLNLFAQGAAKVRRGLDRNDPLAILEGLQDLSDGHRAILGVFAAQELLNPRGGIALERWFTLIS